MLNGFPRGARIVGNKIVFTVTREERVSDALAEAANRAGATYLTAREATRAACDAVADGEHVATLRAALRAAMDAEEAARRAHDDAYSAAYVEEEVEYALPFAWEVCGGCGGHGTHVHRGIDAHGLTSEDLREWDEDEREGYFAGRYDVACEECGGRRVVACPEEPYDGSSRAHKAAWAAYCGWCEDERYSRAERAAEARMGA